MTCGGTVKVFFETYNVSNWQIVIFGAGHVSQALIGLLSNMRCQIQCFDTRPEWLSKLPAADNVTAMHSDNLAAEISKLNANSFVLLMTQGHSTDVPILAEALKHKKFSYLGVIGSKSKRAVVQKDLLEAGVKEELLKDFYCPVGLPIGSNQPAEIAVSIVAQLLAVRDGVSL